MDFRSYKKSEQSALMILVMYDFVKNSNTQDFKIYPVTRVKIK